MDKSCLICKKAFYINPFRVKRGDGKYCSRTCKDLSQVGVKLSQITRNKMSKYWKAHPPKHQLGKKASIETRQKQSAYHKAHPNSGQFKKGHMTSKENRVKMSLAGLGRKKTKEHIRKILTHRSMSGLEITFQSLIDKHNLPYKFVGNGTFFIENINPDFININREKKAVEVYYKKHKEQFRAGGVEGWMKQRTEICDKYGWEILFIEAKQFNEENLLHLLSSS